MNKILNRILNYSPKFRGELRKLYSMYRYVFSDKIKSEGNIKCVTPDDGLEYFFGYYDKSPWNKDGSCMLCLRAKNTWKYPASEAPADIVLIDTSSNSVKKIATTHCWNVQQGCMLQWLGPNFDTEIIFNDFRNGRLCAIILDVFTGKERLLNMPVYAVASDGSFALSLDFSRLHRLRPGYGYLNVPDLTSKESLPNGSCVWKIDLKTGEERGLLQYRDFFDFEHRLDFEGAVHGVNHIMISPNNRRFMILHRWFENGKIDQLHKKTRLVTCDVDGTNMYNLNDDGMVSHCYWRDDEHILSFEKKMEVVGYFLMKDKTHEYTNCWPELNNTGRINNDGHPSYSPDKTMVITDTYPDFQRMARLLLIVNPNSQDYEIQPIARVFHPFRYDNDTRCDLHPRWSRDGSQICFDGVFEGRRRLYVVNLNNK